MLVLFINLAIIHPVAFILDFASFKQFAVSMPKIVLEIADINHTIIIVYLSKATFFVVLVFSSILNSCLSFLEITLPMT